MKKHHNRSNQKLKQKHNRKRSDARDRAYTDRCSKANQAMLTPAPAMGWNFNDTFK